MLVGGANSQYDYVIIGGGTAGCVLASRLTEDKDVSVIVLEAGAADGNWKIEMPAAYDYVFRNSQVNWCYEGEPEETLGGRRLYQPRGKVLGGSSSVNGLGFIRGHPMDFERWVEEGAKAWGTKTYWNIFVDRRVGKMVLTNTVVVVGR